MKCLQKKNPSFNTYQGVTLNLSTHLFIDSKETELSISCCKIDRILNYICASWILIAFPRRGIFHLIPHSSVDSALRALSTLRGWLLQYYIWKNKYLKKHSWWILQSWLKGYFLVNDLPTTPPSLPHQKEIF